MECTSYSCLCRAAYAASRWLPIRSYRASCLFATADPILSYDWNSAKYAHTNLHYTNLTAADIVERAIGLLDLRKAK